MSVGTVDHEMTAEKPLKATAVPIEGYDNNIKLRPLQNSRHLSY